ncbi:MAG: phosphoribosylformylglycinamidine cyclo-ligase [Elusimicrobiota bacterium]|jgi:phosphoribosylformylglycinamidine cyclo-ligase
MPAMTYKKSGVNIDLADKLVDFIQTKAPCIGGYSGLLPLKLAETGDYLLAATTDGVGTKLKLAFEFDSHHTVGIDLVAMNVNDLITCGAKPLLFLDYYAMGKLELDKSKRILEGILEGCRQGRMVLLGGETAEMPGFYPPGEYDLAGFAVGIVHKKDLIDGSKIRPGDVLLGLPSTGAHSNGYSLIRKVFHGQALRRWRKALLMPTKIYVEDVQTLTDGLRKAGHDVLGLAHITGGGIPENLPRILPKDCTAVVRKGSWEVPPVLAELQKRGGVPDADMWRTFNMGVGMIAVVRPQALKLARKLLPQARVIGEIVRGKSCVEMA